MQNHHVRISEKKVGSRSYFHSSCEKKDMVNESSIIHVSYFSPLFSETFNAKYEMKIPNIIQNQVSFRTTSRLEPHPKIHFFKLVTRVNTRDFTVLVLGDKRKTSKENFLIAQKQIISDQNIRKLFRSSHFSFLVFCHFWLRSYENTKILRNLCLHFARQDGQDGKKTARKSRN